MGGSAANRITFVASGVTGTSLGASGGAQNSSLTTASQLPLHTHGVTDPGHTHSNNAASISLSAVAGLQGGANFNLQAATISVATAGISIIATGSSSAFNVLNPAVIVNKIIFTGHG